jgi:hypothetical protein
VLAQRGDRPVQVQVSASYPSKRLMRKEKGSARTVAYAPGAINWGDGMAQAAAFVTPRDPAVDALARQAGRLALELDNNPFGNRNVAFAAAITDACAELGMAYVPDPTNPFATISANPHAVDTVHYPYQTLDRLSGDCDDTTVLMASLLGNLGVNTAFVDVPGHIFLIVDTGLNERNRSALGVDSTLMVIDDEQVWIPLETTSLAKGFAQAWHDGADEIAAAAAQDTVHYFDVTASQVRYEPATPPGDRHVRGSTSALQHPARRRGEADRIDSRGVLRGALRRRHAASSKPLPTRSSKSPRWSSKAATSASARTQLEARSPRRRIRRVRTTTSASCSRDGQRCRRRRALAGRARARPAGPGHHAESRARAVGEGRQPGRGAAARRSHRRGRRLQRRMQAGWAGSGRRLGPRGRSLE